MRLIFWLLGTSLVGCAQDVPRFQVSASSVLVTSAVTDRTGRPVLDMRPDEFIISDNGVPRRVQNLWRDVDLPLTIGLILDVSDSQVGYVEEHRRTIVRFLENSVQPNDRAFLVAVGPGVKLLSDLTHSVDNLRASLGRLPRFSSALPGPINWGQLEDFGEQCSMMEVSGNRQPKRQPQVVKTVPEWRCGGTLLWNGVYSSAHLKVGAIVGRKALVVLTDGLDSGSSHTLEDAIEAAQSADTVVYTIRYPASLPKVKLPASRARRLSDEMSMVESEAASRLRRLSEETGGSAFDDPKREPRHIFDEIESDLRSLYIAEITIPQNARDGAFHSLKIKTTRGGVTIKARKGYVAFP